MALKYLWINVIFSFLWIPCLSADIFSDFEEIKKIPIPEYRNEDVLNTIERQLKVLRTGNYSEAYQTYTTSDFRAATSLQDFINFVQRFPALLQNKNVLLRDLDFRGIEATFRGQLQSEGGQKIHVEYHLRQEEKAWKIQAIHVYSF